MKTAWVIVNGTEFPYFLADRAIARAAGEGYGLHALFLTAAKELRKGYVYPSDINQAEALSDDGDSEKDNAALIRDQMKLFIDTAGGKSVTATAEWLADPSLDEVLEKLEGADRLFLAPGYGDLALLAVTRFRLEELADRAPCPVEIVEDGYREDRFA